MLRVPLDRGAEGVAVVADGYWPAKQGRDALKLEWDTSAVEKVDSAIQLAAKHVEEARAEAQAELARTEVVLAQEQVQTERERAVADRSREMALKREQERGEVEASKAQSVTEVLLMTAKAEAQATAPGRKPTRPPAGRIREVRPRGSRRKTPQRESYATRAWSAIVSTSCREILGQMMKPAEKIEASGSTRSPASVAPPVRRQRRRRGCRAPAGEQVMDSILGMALQLPALKSIGESIGYDFSAALPKGGGAEGGKKAAE